MENINFLSNETLVLYREFKNVSKEAFEIIARSGHLSINHPQGREDFRRLAVIDGVLTKIFMDVLGTAERPDGSKVLSTSPHVTRGQRKKDVLELLNYVLGYCGEPLLPGPMGEVIFNELTAHEYKN